MDISFPIFCAFCLPLFLWPFSERVCVFCVVENKTGISFFVVAQGWAQRIIMLLQSVTRPRTGKRGAKHLKAATLMKERPEVGLSGRVLEGFA